MSKGSLFWANARGKLGETVFYRAGGEQRNRSYVAKIKNPKTVAQAEQRLSMLNFSASYRALKPILEASFPNRQSNQSGFNAFMKANKTISFPVITKSGADEGLAVLGDAVVANGNLVEYGSAKLFTSIPDSTGVVYEIPVPVDGSTALGELMMYSAEGLIPFTSVDVVTKGLAALGLPADLVINVIVGSYEDEGYRYEITTISKDGISGRHADLVGLVNSNFTGEDGMVPIPGQIVGLGFLGDTEDSDETYVGVILSRKVDGKIDVTPTRMFSLSSNVELTAQFRRGGDVYNQLMAEYQPSSGNVLSV